MLPRCGRARNSVPQATGLARGLDRTISCWFTPTLDLPLRKAVLTFLLLVFLPIGVSAARYYWVGDGRGNWQANPANAVDEKLQRHVGHDSKAHA